MRIPIGYWAFQKYGNDPYVQGAKDYLSQALEWAQQTGLQVWIDLHGAPLSQNGFDNSGQRTNSFQFLAGDTAGFMAGVIDQAAAEFGNHPAVAGIELVNEPQTGSLPGGRSALSNYLGQAYAAVRKHSGKSVVIQDGFQAPSSWNGFLTDSIIDHHEYQVFTNADVRLSYADHASQAYARAANWGGSDRRLIIGEWTAAMTDCAPALVSSHLFRSFRLFPFLAFSCWSSMLISAVRMATASALATTAPIASPTARPHRTSAPARSRTSSTSGTMT